MNVGPQLRIILPKWFQLPLFFRAIITENKTFLGECELFIRQLYSNSQQSTRATWNAISEIQRERNWTSSLFFLNSLLCKMIQKLSLTRRRLHRNRGGHVCGNLKFLICVQQLVPPSDVIRPGHDFGRCREFFRISAVVVGQR